MRRFKSIIKCILIWLLSSLLLLAAAAAVFLFLLYRGPSPHYRQRFVREQLDAGRGSFLVEPFLSDSEIAALLEDAP